MGAVENSHSCGCLLAIKEVDGPAGEGVHEAPPLAEELLATAGYWGREGHFSPTPVGYQCSREWPSYTGSKTELHGLLKNLIRKQEVGRGIEGTERVEICYI